MGRHHSRAPRCPCLCPQPPVAGGKAASCPSRQLLVPVGRDREHGQTAAPPERRLARRTTALLTGTDTRGGIPRGRDTHGAGAIAAASSAPAGHRRSILGTSRPDPRPRASPGSPRASPRPTAGPGRGFPLATGGGRAHGEGSGIRGCSIPGRARGTGAPGTENPPRPWSCRKPRGPLRLLGWEQGVLWTSIPGAAPAEPAEPHGDTRRCRDIRAQLPWMG